MGHNPAAVPVGSKVFTKGQIVNILGFAGQMVPVATPQPSYYTMNADTDIDTT